MKVIFLDFDGVLNSNKYPTGVEGIGDVILEPAKMVLLKRIVEATGARGLVASCVYPVAEGMEITISSPKATSARRTSVELLLSNHNKNCQQCDKNGYCELLHVAKLTGARDDMYQGE